MANCAAAIFPIAFRRNFGPACFPAVTYCVRLTDHRNAAQRRPHHDADPWASGIEPAFFDRFLRGNIGVLHVRLQIHDKARGKKIPGVKFPRLRGPFNLQLRGVNAEISPMPHRPEVRPRQYAGTPTPTGVTAPMPVITILSSILRTADLPECKAGIVPAEAEGGESATSNSAFRAQSGT